MPDKRITLSINDTTNHEGIKVRIEKKLKNVYIDTRKEPPREAIQALRERLYREGISLVLRKQTGNSSKEREEAALYITDSSEIGSFYKGRPVLIWLHEDNGEESFRGYSYLLEGFDDVDGEYLDGVYRRLRGIPRDIAVTKRLHIREMRVEDLDDIYELYKNPELLPFLEPLQENREEEAAYLERYINHMYGMFEYGMWLIFLEGKGTLIGRMGFTNTEEEDVLEFGFMIAPKYQGQGYATEAGEAVFSYMKEHFPAFSYKAVCDNKNRAAVALCNKLKVPVEINGKTGGFAKESL